MPGAKITLREVMPFNETRGVEPAGWALEISLDVQWTHAIDPGAKILLAAEDYAKMYATYVSNIGAAASSRARRPTTHTSRRVASASSCHPATRGRRPSTHALECLAYEQPKRAIRYSDRK
jgi:hypothetical protein